MYGKACKTRVHTQKYALHLNSARTKIKLEQTGFGESTPYCSSFPLLGVQWHNNYVQQDYSVLSL